MKKQNKKLQVRIETIRQLSDQELHNPVGGDLNQSRAGGSCFMCELSREWCPF